MTANLEKHFHALARIIPQVEFRKIGLEDEYLEEVSSIAETIFLILGHEDIAELVAEAVDQNILTLFQAVYLLNTAIWSGESNGESLCKTAKKWLLCGEDSQRVEMALRLDVIVLDDVRLLKSISQNFGAHKELCEKLILQIRRGD